MINFHFILTSINYTLLFALFCLHKITNQVVQLHKNHFSIKREMDTDCPICLEPFSAPIFILNCGHNLCGECVENLKNQDEDDDEWPCPICRAMQEKSRDLPRNFFAEQVTLWIETLVSFFEGNGSPSKCFIIQCKNWVWANHSNRTRISKNKVWPEMTGNVL